MKTIVLKCTCFKTDQGHAESMKGKEVVSKTHGVCTCGIFAFKMLNIVEGS
jgi:hypothetical protein